MKTDATPRDRGSLNGRPSCCQIAENKAADGEQTIRQPPSNFICWEQTKMGHNVGDQANRAVAKSEKKAAEAKRTPEQRLAAIRGSLTAKLFVVPDDVRFLLGLYDELRAIADQQTRAIQIATETTLADTATITSLQAQVEQFRLVYEQENRSQTLRVERTMPIPSLDDPTALGEIHPHEIHRFEDDGGPVFVEHGGEA